jgi:hypothetical protein
MSVNLRVYVGPVVRVKADEIQAAPASQAKALAVLTQLCNTFYCRVTKQGDLVLLANVPVPGIERRMHIEDWDEVPMFLSDHDALQDIALFTKHFSRELHELEEGALEGIPYSVAFTVFPYYM